MKKGFKAIIGGFLSVLLLLWPLCFPLAAAETGMQIPTVYVIGQGYELLDSEGNTIYNYTATLPSDDYIQQQAKKLVPLLAAGIVTQRFERFSRALVDAVLPVYDKLRPNKDGSITDGSHANWSYSRDTIAAVTPDANGEYPVDAFEMYWDWRLDPVEAAKQLDAFINDILAVTGAPQVHLVSRCLGSSVALSYVTLYGAEKIRSLLFFSPTCYGDRFSGQLFSGKLNLSPAAIERYMTQSFSGFGGGAFAQPATVALLKATVQLLVESHQLDIHAVITKHNFEKIKQLAYSDILLGCYGSFASYWSMVGEADYEDAKALVFKGKEEEYAAFLKRIDYYHYEIQQKMPQTLAALQQAGIHVGNLSKYGFQMIPLLENSDCVGDEMLDLTSSAFGVFTSSVTGTLPDAYITAAIAGGKQAYLSPDKQVDASTGCLPETTWIIKDLPHRLFPESCNRLMAAFLRNAEMTTETDPAYPRYLRYDAQNDQLLPLTADNAQTVVWQTGLFAAIRAFFTSLGAFLRQSLQQLFQPAH